MKWLGCSKLSPLLTSPLSQASDDTKTNVERLCYKAAQPIHEDIIKKLGIEELGIQVGSVCVYPSRVRDARACLDRIGACHVPVTAVATGFPTGQYPLETRLKEVEWAVSQGASEIDIVINRQLALSQDWQVMKSILAIGELGSLENIYKAGMVCMMAGSDFIKTSTGKEGVNAYLPAGMVMVRAIRDFHQVSGRLVGLKPAGGLKTRKDALDWMVLVKDELGNEWLNSSLFRIGASSLLGDVEKTLFHYAYGYAPAEQQLA
ncbi:unnamed protein product, partial [Darwinula stevensoni]